MTRNCCSKVSLVLIRAIVFYFNILGVLPFKYNVTQHTLEASNWAFAYSIFINLFVIGVMALQVPHLFNDQTVKLSISGTFVTTTLHFLQFAVSAVTLIVTVLKQWIGRKELITLIADAQAVRNSYFDGKSLVKSKFFDRCMIARSFLILAQMGSNLYTMFGLHIYPSRQFYLCYLLICFLYYEMYAIETQYYLGILYICCHLDQLNSDLKKIHWKVRSNKRLSIDQSICVQRSYELAEEIGLITITHSKLTRLGRQLTVFFQWQVLVLMTNLLTATTFSGHAFIVFLRGKFALKNLQTSLMFPQYMIANILSFMLNICICQRKFNLTQDIRRKLKGLAKIGHLESHLTRSIDQMALQCSCENYSLRVCGLFDLSNKTVTDALQATFLYLIVLIQIDYENL